MSVALDALVLIQSRQSQIKSDCPEYLYNSVQVFTRGMIFDKLMQAGFAVSREFSMDLIPDRFCLDDGGRVFLRKCVEEILRDKIFQFPIKSLVLRVRLLKRVLSS